MMDEDLAYKKLKLWRRSDEFAYKVYLITKDFPSHEMLGITTELRRTSLLIPLNIGEGYGKKDKDEIKKHFKEALGAISKMEYLLKFSLRLKYLPEIFYDDLEMLRIKTGCSVWRFYHSF